MVDSFLKMSDYPNCHGFYHPNPKSPIPAQTPQNRQEVRSCTLLGLILGIGVPFIAATAIGTFRTSHLLLTSANLMILGGQILVLFALFGSKSLKAYCKRKAGKYVATVSTVKVKSPSLPENPTGKELFTVDTFDHRAMADVCRVAIEQEGITVFMADDHLVGGVNFLLSNAVRGIKVQVSDIDARRAVEICHRAEPAAETNVHDTGTTVDFDCEECGKAISFLGHRRGRVETCPQCGQYVDVPE